MKKFLFKFLKFMAFSFASLILSFALFMLINSYKLSDFPAINFSNSYSFNEKMMFLEGRSNSYSIMGMGSSMGLNNLHPEPIIEKFETDSYINIASWGLNNEEIYNFLKITYPHFKPTNILFPGSLYDYMVGGKKFRPWMIESFLNQTFPRPFYYFATFDLKYYLDNFDFAKEVRTYPHNYDYLNFDEFGSINLYSEVFEIDSIRYKNRIINEIEIDEKQYAYLDSIVTFCDINNIKLIYSDMPLRADLRSTMTEAELKIFEEHGLRIEKIIANQTFIKSQSFDLEVSHYYDNTHLTAAGAKIFTGQMLKKVQTE